LNKSIKEVLYKLKHSTLQNCEGRIQVKTLENKTGVETAHKVKKTSKILSPVCYK